MSSLIPIVSIEGVDKAELFALLYAEAKIFNETAVITITRGEAAKILQTETAFRNFKGKRMWVDLSDNSKVHFYWYDKHNGLGKGRAVLKKLLDKMTFRAPANTDLQERRNIRASSSNTTGDFIPNPITPAQQSAGHLRNRNMNGVIAARTPKVVNTSQIYNAATQKQRVDTTPKKVQVINYRPRPIRVDVEASTSEVSTSDNDTSTSNPVREINAANGDAPASDSKTLFERKTRRRQ